MNYELVTYTPADWVCLFEVRFVALWFANDYVRVRPFSLECRPSRIGSSARFLSCEVWVCFLQCGDHWG